MAKRLCKYIAGRAVAVLAAISVSLIFVQSGHAAPQAFTVTNTNDSGAGSLRQAISDANGNANAGDMDVIEFNISGSEVHTIVVNSDLPLITEKVTVDGYTQPGSSANTSASPNPLNSVIKIEISGGSATLFQGIIGLVADGSILRGLAIYDGAAPDANVAKATVALIGNSTTLQGSYIGVRADGTTPGEYDKNCASVLVVGTSVLVGGTNDDDRNLFLSRCSVGQGAGVIIVGSAEVYGNYVGIAKDGATDLTPEAADANGLNAPFSMSINMVNTGGSTIGGAASSKRNVISGNTANVIISSPANVVQGNIIGARYDGTVSDAITNGMGVTVVAGSDSIIGGTNNGEGNLIAGVKGSGIEISSMDIPLASFTLTPSRIAALGNSIKAIKPFALFGIGNTNLGIDISKFTDSDGNFVPDQFAERGPTTNDVSDVDSGPNGTINTPVLKTAQQIGSQLTITYNLDADDAEEPNNQYRVEFFANDESSIFGYGPGESFLGSAVVTPGNNKTATLTVSGDHTNKALSATTTAVDSTTNSGFGSTSEFARNISIGSESDFDSDGASDAVEDAAPNSGDANNDGTADRLQPTVTSFEIDSTSVYETLVTQGCSENGTVASVDVSTLSSKDTGKVYPYGLVDFTLNCSRGDTVTVTKYVFVDDQPTSYVLRKYNPNRDSYTDVTGSTITSQTVGSSQALVSTYAITDGGEFDDDGTANGVIVDPVGLATTTSLADTGENVWLYGAGALSILAVGAYLGFRRGMQGAQF